MFISKRKLSCLKNRMYKGRWTPMLAEERKLKIMEYVAEYGSVRVSDLAEEFVVSTETVRRYLDELEKDQKLKKVYGGAVRLSEKEEPPILNRETKNRLEKRLIAEQAVSFILEGDVVFIDEGTTTLQMADGLSRFKEITVMTTSFPLANRLMQTDFEGDIIFLGGLVQKDHWRTAGSLTTKVVRELHADKAFIAVDGVHPEFGLSCYDSDKAVLGQMYMEQVETSYALADYSKMNMRATHCIAPLQQVDFIVTDRPAEGSWSNDNWVVAQP